MHPNVENVPPIPPVHPEPHPRLSVQEMVCDIVSKAFLPRISNLSLIKSVDLTTNLWVIQNTEEHIKPCYRNAVSKKQNVGNSIGQIIQFL